MTIALCVNCGSLKFGSFVSCNDCGFVPESEIDMAYSLAISDHYFKKEVLDQISEAMKNGHPRPSLPPDQEEVFLRTVRESPMSKMLGKLIG
jgi:hypothetical protein